MPTGLYECVHVPVKGAWWAVKNPVPVGIGGAVAFAIYVGYGIWPFLVVAAILAAMFGGLVALAVMNGKTANSSRGKNHHSMREHDLHFQSHEQVSCMRHPESLAREIYRMHLPDGKVKEVPLCAPCVPEFREWIAQKQLSGGFNVKEIS